MARLTIPNGPFDDSKWLVRGAGPALPFTTSRNGAFWLIGAHAIATLPHGESEASTCSILDARWDLLHLDVLIYPGSLIKATMVWGMYCYNFWFHLQARCTGARNPCYGLWCVGSGCN